MRSGCFSLPGFHHPATENGQTLAGQTWVFPGQVREGAGPACASSSVTPRLARPSPSGHPVERPPALPYPVKGRLVWAAHYQAKSGKQRPGSLNPVGVSRHPVTESLKAHCSEPATHAHTFQTQHGARVKAAAFRYGSQHCRPTGFHHLRGQSGVQGKSHYNGFCLEGPRPCLGRGISLQDPGSLHPTCCRPPVSFRRADHAQTRHLDSALTATS